MKELLTEMIKALVDKPDEVDITLTESENTKIYELRLGDGDVGKVIGKKGRNVSQFVLYFLLQVLKRAENAQFLK